MQRTGSYSSPWQRDLPIDTAEIAYLKAKRSAERYQVLQFAVCPFSVKDLKLIAHPFNFHLFPRDELKLGMPSYGFSCQSSHLITMAREGFDFNACFYNGISYLSRAQESAAMVRMVNLRSNENGMQSSSVHSVADSVFIERIKSRVKNWRNACKDNSKTDGEQTISLPYHVLSFLSLFSMLKGFADVVPLRVPTKGGGMQVVRVVFTCSEEDRRLLEEELQNMEEEQNRNNRGFREVIDLISTSQKPVVAHNSLNGLSLVNIWDIFWSHDYQIYIDCFLCWSFADFASIYSKFIAPLPPTIDDFRSSLLLAFPFILDTNHLLTKCSPFEKLGSISGSISYLKKRFSAPIDMEIPDQGKYLSFPVLYCELMYVPCLSDTCIFCLQQICW
ncbi:poly(A)-specific ribonuclease PARN-like [Dorcoceras hygrometricum]|uniref:Poly(A)-specific ribonuclease PARN-like n=1 Tax=Dorcoceras hygrometricum TaxID=472368 RepID=A0A2Z7BBF4_9LAMI|nr:poly(A)-specific ribonuclease PARN-like [Dorcoceras hygrometricum]